MWIVSTPQKPRESKRHPILKAVKRLPDYKRQSRLEDDKLVLKGRPYTVSMLNQLPDELNTFKVTSKEDAFTVGFFGGINPLSNCHRSLTMAYNTSLVNNLFK